MIRSCQLCGDPLPEDARWNRRYHPACSIEAYRLYKNEFNSRYFKAKRKKARIEKKYGKPRKRNPMLYLGKDYVDMKLKGQIKL